MSAYEHRAAAAAERPPVRSLARSFVRSFVRSFGLFSSAIVYVFAENELNEQNRDPAYQLTEERCRNDDGGGGGSFNDSSQCALAVTIVRVHSIFQARSSPLSPR